MDDARTGASQDQDAPRLLDTYALAYASGIVWLFIAMVLLGAQKSFSFDAGYDFTLTFPPFATALTVLLLDRRGTAASLLWKVPLFATVCGVASALSTVILTPLLIAMFRGGVTGNLGLTGIVASIALVVVSLPVVAGVVSAARRQAWGRAVVLVVGVLAAAIALAMALDPMGALATSMRLDQAEITMVTAAWWLPFFALTAAYARRLGVA